MQLLEEFAASRKNCNSFTICNSWKDLQLLREFADTTNLQHTHFTDRRCTQNVLTMFCPAVTDGRGWLVAPPHHPKFEKCCKAQIKRKGLRRGGRKYFLLRASLASFPSWPRLYFQFLQISRDLRVAIKDLKLVWLAGWLSWRRNDHRSHVLIHRLRLHSPLSFHASRSYLHLIYLWSMI